MVVVDAAPVRAWRRRCGKWCRGARAHCAGDLVAVVQIVDGVEDRVGIVDIDDRPVGEDTAACFPRSGPILRVPQKSSSMRKPPRSRYSRKLLGLRVGQLPVAHLAGVEPGPVVDVVAVVQVDGLLDGAGVEARQPAEGLGEVAVGARIILGPAGAAFAPVESAAPAPAPGEAGERMLADTSGGRRPIRSFRRNPQAARRCRRLRGCGRREMGAGRRKRPRAR